MWEAILDAVIDSLKALPVLLIVYMLIEFMEHRGGVKFEKAITKSKKFGPVIGAGFGVIPQCGFSAVMADLFSRKMITIGTLFAVFVATSDEAFALMLSSPNNIKALLLLLGLKFVLAVIVGYILDLIFRNQKLQEDKIAHTKHLEHEHSHLHEVKTENCEQCDVEEKSCDDCIHDHLHHSHELEEENKTNKGKVFWHIVWQGTKHTLEIFAFILIANILISVILNLAGGEDALKAIMGTNAWYQPIICSLIGLIPNCAGSVALVELYSSGIISFASCLGGLCTGAGIGLLVLYKSNKSIKTNIFITMALFLFGAIVGMIFNLFLPKII